MDEHIKRKMQAWHKIEYLTPYTIEHDDDTIPIADNLDLPWINPEKYNLVETEKHSFRHQVFIGVFDIEEMMSVVRKVFQDDEINQRYNEYKVKSVYAEVTVDHTGFYIQGSFKVSTVPFALGKLEIEGAGQYEAWHQPFREIELELQSYILQQLQGSVTLNTLTELLKILVDKMQWTPRFRKRLFWVRTDQILKQKISQEAGGNEEQQDEEIELPGILNSFYLRELESILESAEKTDDCIGKGLNEYLSSEGIGDSERIDIDNNRSSLTQILNPRNIPLGKWPGNDKHTLNFMQQAAVNQMFIKLSDKPGLFSVNGPPGTGKTTLLRDVIAAIIVNKAQQLTRFDNPNSAFSVKKTLNGYPLYALDAKLCGQSIVIASSNNGAVENISMELPEKAAIDPTYLNHDGASYFREVAKTISGPNNWGLIAAKLGKSSNRYKFFSKFWYKPNDEPGTSFRQLLTQTKESKKNMSGSDLLKNWELARRSFQIALKGVLTEQQRAESIYRDVLRVQAVKRRIQRWMIEVSNLESVLDSENNRLNQDQNDLHDNQRQQDSKQKQLEYLEKIRFGFFGVLLRFKEFLHVRRKKNELYMQCVTLEKNRSFLEGQVKAFLEKTTGLSSKIEIYKTKIENGQSKLHTIQQMLRNEKIDNNRVIMDEEFWEQPLASIQKSSPWITLMYTQARSRLFLEALRLHESFIMAAQSKIIGSLYAITKPSSIDYHADKDLFPGLWDVFTLIVPVVSSTFASFAGMFKGMESQSLGWLFIDEAGQAVPQAAVGAIWRAQRTVVVGDPLQIEPVVTLPKIVLQDVANYYEVSDRFISINRSVQTVADMANKNGTWIRDKWIGSPLWVHRRCISPMFDICNEIAYDGRMVLDTSSPNPDTIVNIDRLGPNAWIQVDGDCTVKQFVPEQARVVLRLIWKAFEPNRLGLNDELPSLYIISPFAVVKHQLIMNVREAHRHIAGNLSKKEFNRWVDQSVGTVHTFQGKQADAVIFILGVDGKNSEAAGWATSSVNLVNVAVSRAKYRFIVVGDKKIWSTKEYMCNVHRYLAEQYIT